MYETVRRSAEGIGIDPTNVACHSLRSGCITWLSMEGVPLHRIMDQSGHENLGSLLIYVRPLRTPENSPLMLTRRTR